MKRYWYLLPSIVWTVSIVFASLVSVRNLKKFRLDTLFSFDKLAHVIMYAGMCFLLLWGFDKFKQYNGLHKKLIIYMLSISIVLGVVMEVLQKLIATNRNFDYYDIIANIIGALIGSALFLTSKNNKVWI